MSKFFMGLALGILGFLMWVVASVLAALAAVPEDKQGLFASPVFGALVVTGFLVMIGGPFLYWLVLPVIAFFRRLGRKEMA